MVERGVMTQIFGFRYSVWFVDFLKSRSWCRMSLHVVSVGGKNCLAVAYYGVVINGKHFLKKLSYNIHLDW